MLGNVPCALEKNVYSAAIGWNFLYMSVSSIWSEVWFKSNISLLIFCLDDLSIVENGVLKFHAILELSIYLFRSVSIC